ncbi:ATP-binding protein [Alteromonas sp. H39]|uniref:ATP-binding protein n=1 Tax=Alteromonas sp. H39 TaxID=3389876 RepID=UPI0039E0B4FC
MTRLFFSLYLFIALSLVTLTVGLEQFFPVDSPALTESQQAWLTLLKQQQESSAKLARVLTEANLSFDIIDSDAMAVSHSVASQLAKQELVQGFYEEYWQVYVPTSDAKVVTVTFSEYPARPGNWWLYSSIFFILLGVAIAIWIYPLWRDLSSLVTATRNLGPDGGITVPTLSTNSPLSNIARALDDLSQNVKMLLNNQRELAGAVTHEFKTPLARLKFALAGENGMSEAEATEARKDIDELDKLVQEMLDFTRLNAHRPELLMESIPLIPFCQQRASLIQPHSNKILTVSGDATELTGDSHLLARATDNLLANAVRHAHHRVEIIIERTPSGISLHVDDDGDGIEDACKEMVFDAFFRPDSARSRHQGGAGLGLAIVKRIMHWHGGTCAATDSKSGGARISLHFPTNATHSR